MTATVEKPKAAPPVDRRHDETIASLIISKKGMPAGYSKSTVVPVGPCSYRVNQYAKRTIGIMDEHYIAASYFVRVSTLDGNLEATVVE